MFSYEVAVFKKTKAVTIEGEKSKGYEKYGKENDQF